MSELGGTVALSSFLAATGDFFAPKGGWMALLLAGFAGVGLVIAIWISNGSLFALLEKIDRPFFASWWRGRPVWAQHGFHVVMIFVVSCFFTGFAAYREKDAGGLLASRSAIVSDMQVAAGIMEEQRKTTAAVEALTDVTRQVERNTAAAKLEDSEDPRKEIANLGLSWNQSAFSEAIRREDLPVIRLFAEGGMQIQKNQFFGVILEKLNIVEAFQGVDYTLDPRACHFALAYVHAFAEENDWRKSSDIKASEIRLSETAVRNYSYFCSDYAELSQTLAEKYECRLQPQRAICEKLRTVLCEYGKGNRCPGLSAEIKPELARDRTQQLVDDVMGQ
ncbi:hypothetical protein [Lysobacter sp. A03]|uniref:hypothetical protein n=1 Tax=Lysobacter sp. A03 TaxID=1199154 RepID=UPI0005B6C853|nr:hypothetical protein [Lysobacter sp. A03]KIQ97353.1 hypothetical protein TI01_1070 [Lysobacter sp. A03]